MFKFKFLGSTRIPHRKNTSELSPVRISAPKEVILPMEQHIGAPATPVVKVGDEVKVGQLIAEASGYVSAPIYSSVSGKVTKIDSITRANGRNVTAVRIESDGAMTPCENIKAPEITDLESFIAAIRASGVVGLGGAGFPTAVKFDALKKGIIHTVVLNGAECEPYLTSDARTMLDDADYIRKGIELIKRFAPEVKSYIIGIEGNKPECIKKMKETFKDDGSVSVKTLPSLYPQGAEKVLISNTVGVEVPEGKLPADVGVIVTNVTTLAFIAKYAETGMPLVEKCVTVDGSCVKEPKNLLVPIGTPIRELLDFVGVDYANLGKVIHGGPMTGPALCSLDEPVVKTTGGAIALSIKDSTGKKSTACIHCGRCVEACPHRLNPQAFTDALKVENLDDRMKLLEDSSIGLCVECGCCTFVCPANRHIMEKIRIAKNSLKEYKAHKASLKGD